MKVKFENDLLIVYLYNKTLDIDDNDSLVKEIKDILKSLIIKYDISLNGMYDVIMYENTKFGYILEIKQIKAFEYSDYIDIKLSIKRNCVFYLEFIDYFLIKEIGEIFYKNNCFYVNIEKILNVNKLIEFAEIIYKKEMLDICECVNIKSKSVN